MSEPDPALAEWWRLLRRAAVDHDDLSVEDTEWVMDQVMSGSADPMALSNLLVALEAKGKTAAEMDGFVRSMLRHAHRIDVAGPVVDVVGTGGDGAHTVNISTMAALVVAGTGARVVKHGNRAASSRCGAADVLEELGVDLTLTPDAVAAVADEAGITFCFAQVFHPAMRHAAAVRGRLGIPSVFNYLGPLTNPAQPQAQAVGCGNPQMVGVMAEVFARRGVSALVFRGDDGLDELTTTTTSQVHVVREGAVRVEVLDPARLGVAPAGVDDLRGGDAAFNAAVVRDLLAGQRGAVRDAVVLNAAGALVSLAAQDGALEDQMVAAMSTASAAIDSGAAARVLDRWVEVSRAHAAG